MWGGNKMLALILKDIALQKKYIALSLVYVLIFLLAFQNSDVSSLTISLIIVAYTLVNTSAAMEDKSKADILLNSLPISRRKLVLEKYLNVLVYMVIASIYYLIVTTVINILNLPINISPIKLNTLLFSIFSVILMINIYFPVLFKYGYLKSRIVSFIMFFGIIFSSSSLFKYIENNINIKFNTIFESLSESYIMALFIGLTLIITFFSYMLSVKIYTNREF